MRSLSRSFAAVALAILLVVLFAWSLRSISARHGPGVAVGVFVAVNVVASQFFVSRKLCAGSTAFARNLADIDLSKTPALPNGAATAYSEAIKLGPGVHPDGIEVEVTIPNATTGEAPDTRTLTVDLVADDTTTPTTAASLPRVFTGAGGAGFTGATWRLKLAVTAGDYFRLRMVGGTSFGNMSGKTATLRVLQ